MTWISPARRLTALDALSRLLKGERLDHGDHALWDEVAALATELDVQAALWARVRTDPELFPSTVAESLREWGRGNTLRNARLRDALREVVTALNARAVEPLLIKGAVRLVDGTLTSLGDRWLADLDLLIPSEDEELVHEALVRLGYGPVGGRSFSHPHEVPYAHGGRPGLVEVHLELGSPPLATVLPAAEAWSRSMPVELETLRVRALPPTLQVLHNVLHSSVQDLNHAVGGLPLRQLTDLAGLVRAHGEAIDWTEIHARMAAAGLADALTGHLWLAHRYTGMPLPGEPWCIPARGYERWVRVVFALSWPADLQRNLRYAFARQYLDSLYGHGDHPLHLAAVRAEHAWRIVARGVRGAIAQALIRRS